VTDPKRDAERDAERLRREEAARWKAVSERKYPSTNKDGFYVRTTAPTLIHAKDDIYPPSGRTKCGLPLKGALVLEHLPLDWVRSLTCLNCRQRVIECMNQGNPL
jgi:hypothetical protein